MSTWHGPAKPCLPVTQLPFLLAEFPDLLLNLPLSVLDPRNQLRGKRTQLFWAEIIEVGG
jgi:hypothetical protein